MGESHVAPKFIPDKPVPAKVGVQGSILGKHRQGQASGLLKGTLLDWANAAIISTAILAVVNILDSHLVSKRMPSFGAFLIATGILSIINGAILFGLFPLPQDIGVIPLLVTIASSILRTLGVLLILHILRTGEVSRVIPVVHIHPVFVAILAVLFLGETLAYLDWIAIIITAGGAVLISIERNSSGSRIGVGRSLAMPLIAGLLLAIANLTSKYALEHVSHWSMLAVGMLAMAFVFLGIGLRPLALRDLRSLRRPVPALVILALSGILVLVGMLFLFWSIQNGPVSLVSAIAGARPAFVLICALILSRISTVLLEQRLRKETIVLRSVAIAMIVGGIAIIHLA